MNYFAIRIRYRFLATMDFRTYSFAPIGELSNCKLSSQVLFNLFNQSVSLKICDKCCLISDFWISQKQIIRSCWFYCCSKNNKPLLYKDIYFSFIEYTKAFNCVDHNKLWEILKEMGLSDPLTCLMQNLYAGQEATVRTGHGKTDWFQIEKGVHQGCILSSCLLNL